MKKMTLLLIGALVMGLGTICQAGTVYTLQITNGAASLHAPYVKMVSAPNPKNGTVVTVNGQPILGGAEIHTAVPARPLSPGMQAFPVGRVYRVANSGSTSVDPGGHHLNLSESYIPRWDGGSSGGGGPVLHAPNESGIQLHIIWINPTGGGAEIHSFWIFDPVTVGSIFIYLNSWGAIGGTDASLRPVTPNPMPSSNGGGGAYLSPNGAGTVPNAPLPSNAWGGDFDQFVEDHFEG